MRSTVPSSATSGPAGVGAESAGTGASGRDEDAYRVPSDRGAAGRVARRWAVDEVGEGEADRAQHPLEQGQPAIHPTGWGLAVLVRRARQRGGRTVRLKRLAAVPLADVEQPGWIVDVLIETSE